MQVRVCSRMQRRLTCCAEWNEAKPNSCPDLSCCTTTADVFAMPTNVRRWIKQTGTEEG